MESYTYRDIIESGNNDELRRDKTDSPTITLEFRNWFFQCALSCIDRRISFVFMSLIVQKMLENKLTRSSHFCATEPVYLMFTFQSRRSQEVAEYPPIVTRYRKS